MQKMDCGRFSRYGNCLEVMFTDKYFKNNTRNTAIPSICKCCVPKRDYTSPIIECCKTQQIDKAQERPPMIHWKH